MPEPFADSKVSQTPAPKQSGQSNTFKKGFLNSLSTPKKSVETSVGNNSKGTSDATKSVVTLSEG